jgi:hypothetical protein
MTYHQFFNKNNTTGPISGAGTAFSFGAPEFTPGFSGVRITQSLFFCRASYRSMFVFFLFVIVLSVLLLLLLSGQYLQNFPETI